MSTTRAPKTWRTWTRKELDRLESLRLDGRLVPEIAAALGRTEPSVSVRLSIEGLRRPSRLAARWLPILSRPHTLKSAAAAAGTSVWAAKVVSATLGDRPPMFILNLVRHHDGPAVTATLTEKQWRLIRFALERAGESI